MIFDGAMTPPKSFQPEYVATTCMSPMMLSPSHVSTRSTRCRLLTYPLMTYVLPDGAVTLGLQVSTVTFPRFATVAPFSAAPFRKPHGVRYSSTAPAHGCETSACCGVTCWMNLPGVIVVEPPGPLLFVAPVCRDTGAVRSMTRTYSAMGRIGSCVP